MSAQNHQGFSSKFGYILSAAGSAIGLGNIWRFPYEAAKYGGGIFLLTYVILVLTFGYSMLVTENAIGRMTRKGPVGTYHEFCSGKHGFLKFLKIGGWINAIVPLVIVPYYCVIGGWVTKYLCAFTYTPVSEFAVENEGISANYFLNFISSTWQPIYFFLAFTIILVGVIACGVEKGVERFNKILMPILFVLIVGICIYCCFLPNASDGVLYYLMPDWSKFSYMTVVSAMGQLFFSLSIAMGIMITYGSYMRKEDNLVDNVIQVEIFDTIIAFLAGMMIIPAVVAFGGKEAAETAGPGLVFITMPQVFASFAHGGQIIGIAFFLLVLFAAATSAISLLETNVQTVGQEFKISRQKAIVWCVTEILAIGILTILGYSVLSNVHLLPAMDILDSLDYVSNSVLMPIGAIFTTVLVVAVVGLETFSQNIKQEGKKWYGEFIYQLCMCVIVIPCLLIVLLNATGIIK